MVERAIFPYSDAGDAVACCPLSLPGDMVVGITHFHLSDESRPDPATGVRELMVSAFYPAQAGGEPAARLVDMWEPAAAAVWDELARSGSWDGARKAAAVAAAARLTLRARRDSTPAAGGPHPVLIYYPGGMAHRLSNAPLCEALASLGYLVFTIDAPRDAPAVAYPDGRFAAQGMLPGEDYIWPRIDDVKCLLGGLDELNSTGVFAGMLDLKRVGMFGHSRGGYVANMSAVADTRIKAAVNMDGFLWGLWTKVGTGLVKHTEWFQQAVGACRVPLLRLSGEQKDEAAARSKFEMEAAEWLGDFIFVELAGFNHGSFGLAPWLNGQLAEMAATLGRPPAPGEQVELLTNLIAGFFDYYLTGSDAAPSWSRPGTPGARIWTKPGGGGIVKHFF